jgi:RNA-directed DNA polymerase
MDRGIGDEPNNPTECSEVADGVARQSEGIAPLSLLRPIRQGVPKDVLAFAYACCQANGGAAGVDGQTFEDIETYGVERWLAELAQELKSRTYRPLPVRRVYIPKPDGKQRPLGVPAIRDRTVEMAAVLVLEPIFEADLQPEQYAYRRDRGALDAVRRVHKLINTGHGEIVDADLSSYFDSIPHAELLKSVARRVVDGRCST